MASAASAAARQRSAWHQLAHRKHQSKPLRRETSSARNIKRRHQAWRGDIRHRRGGMTAAAYSGGK